MGRIFYLHPHEIGEHKCASIADHIVDFDDLQTVREDQEQVELISYNKHMDYMEQHTESEEYLFNQIIQNTKGVHQHACGMGKWGGNI